jgi:hypothetical protein
LCELRRRIHIGLNKGEAENAPPRAVMADRSGKLAGRTDENQRHHELAIETGGPISHATTNPHLQQLPRIRVQLPAQYLFFRAKPIFPVTPVNAAPAFKQLVSSQRNSAVQSGNFLVFAIILAARRSCTFRPDSSLHT